MKIIIQGIPEDATVRPDHESAEEYLRAHKLNKPRPGELAGIYKGGKRSKNNKKKSKRKKDKEEEDKKEEEETPEEEPSLAGRWAVADSTAMMLDKPIVVLVNRHSYSATNFFSAYMSTLPNVTLIGDQSGGGGGVPRMTSRTYLPRMVGLVR